MGLSNSFISSLSIGDITQQKMLRLSGLTMAWLSLMPLAHAQVYLLPVPPDQGTPNGRSRGGATRGDCLAHSGLTALVPTVDDVVWSQTASAAPTFFFELPTVLTASVPMEFVIQDSNDNYVFRQAYTSGHAAGVMKIATDTQSENPSELAVGETYHWTLSLYCDVARPSASVSVTGTIKRVADPVAATTYGTDEKLSEAGQYEQIQQYAAAGIWHEAIDQAFALVQTDSENELYQQALTSLLNQAGHVDILPIRPSAVSFELSE